jgi:hypothetical protein
MTGELIHGTNAKSEESKRAHWWIIGLVALATIINYIDRSVI